MQILQFWTILNFLQKTWRGYIHQSQLDIFSGNAEAGLQISATFWVSVGFHPARPKSGNPVVYHHFPTLTWQQACAGGIHALKPNALHVDGTSSKWSHENKTNPSFEASPSAPAKRQQLLNVYGFVQTRILKNWSFHGQVMIHHRFEAFCHVLSK